MRKFLIFIISLLILISCDKEEKWTQTLYKSRFLQTDYFIPTKSKVYANPSNGYYVVLTLTVPLL